MFVTFTLKASKAQLVKQFFLHDMEAYLIGEYRDYAQKHPSFFADVFKGSYR